MSLSVSLGYNCHFSHDRAAKAWKYEVRKKVVKFYIQISSQKQRTKLLTYHIYWWYWPDAVYKYVHIHNSWFNYREEEEKKKKHELLMEPFIEALHWILFKPQRGELKLKSMRLCCLEPSEEWLVCERSWADRLEHLNNDPTQVFITKATAVLHIAACVHSSRRRPFSHKPTVVKVPQQIP